MAGAIDGRSAARARRFGVDVRQPRGERGHRAATGRFLAAPHHGDAGASCRSGPTTTMRAALRNCRDNSVEKGDAGHVQARLVGAMQPGGLPSGQHDRIEHRLNVARP